MPRPKALKRHAGHESYAERERALSAYWRAQGKPVPWRDAHRGEFYESFKRQRLRGDSRAAEELDESSPEPGPSNRDPAEQHSPLDLPSAPTDYLSAANVSESADIPDWSNIDDFIEWFGINPDMEVDPPTVAVAPTPSGSTGSVAPRGSVAASSLIVPFRKSTYSASGKCSFSKSRVLFSYAYGNGTYDASVGYPNVEMDLSSMSFIPVDFLPFYLSPAEFQNLPVNSHVTEVWCKVKILGVRSAFDVGTTVSGHATSEYVPILLSAIGLNKKTDLWNVKYKTVTNMIPSDFDYFKSEEYVSRFYTDRMSSVSCIPRSNPYYAVFYKNKSDGTSTVKFHPHDGGNFRLDTVVNQHLLNQVIGETIIDYKYKPKFAPVKQPSYPKIPTPRLGTHHSLHAPGGFANITNYVQNADKDYIRDFTIKEASTLKTYSNCQFNYSQSIECYNAADPVSGHRNMSMQPQVHVGMCAIPQLNPSTENTTFVNAAVYYQVECGINLEYDMSTAWTKGGPSRHSKDAIMFTIQNKAYSDPSEVYGQCDTISGGAYTFSESVTRSGTQFKPSSRVLNK